MKRYNGLVPGLVLFLTLMILRPTQAQDTKGPQDHPILTRYSGSKVLHYLETDYDEVEIPIGKVRTEMKFLEVSGKVTKYLYKAPSEAQALTVFRNYERALKEKGFKILFEFTDGRKARWYPLDTYKFHNSKFRDEKGDGIAAFGIGPLNTAYIAAESPQGTVISLLIGTRKQPRRVRNGVEKYLGAPLVHLEIIEPEQVATGLVTATAQEHQQNIVAKGSTSLPSDVLFDVDQVVLKPEASAALAEAAKFMAENPQLRLLVVGHTDITGSLAHNANLSLQRAQAVLKALVERHGVDASRLEAAGAGALAPVATNTSEEGRMLNRRVEFVER